MKLSIAQREALAYASKAPLVFVRGTGWTSPLAPRDWFVTGQTVQSLVVHELLLAPRGPGRRRGPATLTGPGYVELVRHGIIPAEEELRHAG